MPSSSAFVEENRDGWTVLFTELTSAARWPSEVAELRGQIADAVRRMVEQAERAGRATARAPRSDAIAHAIVGAGESLANWWLEHPEVPREEVADWYVGRGPGGGRRAVLAAARAGCRR